MANQGCSLYHIAVTVGRSATTVKRWLKLYETKGISFIETKLAEEQRKQMWEERKVRVIDILHSPPATYGLNRTSWTYDLILVTYSKLYGEYLPKGSLKRIIKETNYTWRHARKVLTSTDPEYKQKIEIVFETLRATKPNEAFFFVDEFGPYKVKKYGGKGLRIRGHSSVMSN